MNNDFGVNMVREFSRAYQALGGQIISVTPYNPSQASYQPEVTRAMQGNPDALYLVSYPGDGTTIARTWISQGGAQHLNDAYGTSSGTTKTPSTEYFAREYPPFAKFDAGAPAADRSYDAAAILGLAIAQAGRAESAAIRDAIRKVLDPKGTVIHAGASEFGKAFGLIKEGKPVRYVGVIGPVQFDRYGDITGPFRLWRIQNGQVTTVGEMSVVEVTSGSTLARREAVASSACSGVCRDDRERVGDPAWGLAPLIRRWLQSWPCRGEGPSRSSSTCRRSITWRLSRGSTTR